jgi:hypothetical protein
VVIGDHTGKPLRDAPQLEDRGGFHCHCGRF